MNDPSKKRIARHYDWPEDVRAQMIKAVEDIERDLGEIDLLLPSERAEMEEGLKDLRRLLDAGAEIETPPANYRLN